uniref:Uncharacterized protein n=1 Tax=Arundo donax TaxID=35708 RepID=A0A0A9B1U3_ARUDO
MRSGATTPTRRRHHDTSRLKTSALSRADVDPTGARCLGRRSIAAAHFLVAMELQADVVAVSLDDIVEQSPPTPHHHRRHHRRRRQIPRPRHRPRGRRRIHRRLLLSSLHGRGEPKEPRPSTLANDGEQNGLPTPTVAAHRRSSASTTTPPRSDPAATASSHEAP